MLKKNTPFGDTDSYFRFFLPQSSSLSCFLVLILLVSSPIIRYVLMENSKKLLQFNVKDTLYGDLQAVAAY